MTDFSFAENFWGEKNNGYEVLISFAKLDAKVTNELGMFLREHMLIEENYIKSLHKLVGQIGTFSTFSSTSFSPCWVLLKSLVDKVATVNVQFAHRISECAKQVAAYSETQKERQRVLQHDHDGPCGEAISALQSVTNNLQLTQRTYFTRCTEVEKLKRELGKASATNSGVGASSRSAEAKLRKAQTDAAKASEDYRTSVARYNAARAEFERRTESAFGALQKLTESHLAAVCDTLFSFGNALEHNAECLSLAAREFGAQIRDATQPTPVVDEVLNEAGQRKSESERDVLAALEGDAPTPSGEALSNGSHDQSRPSKLIVQFVTQRALGKTRPAAANFEEFEQDSNPSAAPSVPQKAPVLRGGPLRSLRSKDLSKSMFNVAASGTAAPDDELYAEIDTRADHEPPSASTDNKRSSQNQPPTTDEPESVYEDVLMTSQNSTTGTQKEPDAGGLRRQNADVKPEKQSRALFPGLGIFSRKDKKKSTSSTGMAHASSVANLSSRANAGNVIDDVFAPSAADSDGNRYSTLIRFDDDVSNPAPSVKPDVDSSSAKYRSDLIGLNLNTDSSGRDADRPPTSAHNDDSDSFSDDSSDDDRTFRNIQVKIKPVNEAVGGVSNDQLLLAARAIKPNLVAPPPREREKPRSASRSEWNLTEDNGRSGATFTQFDIDFDIDGEPNPAELKRSKTVDESLSMASTSAWTVPVDPAPAGSERRASTTQFESNFFETGFDDAPLPSGPSKSAESADSTSSAKPSSDAFGDATPVQLVHTAFDDNFEVGSFDARVHDTEQDKSRPNSKPELHSNGLLGDDSKSHVSLEEPAQSQHAAEVVYATPVSIANSPSLPPPQATNGLPSATSLKPPAAQTRQSVLINFDPLGGPNKQLRTEQSLPPNRASPVPSISSVSTGARPVSPTQTNKTSPNAPSARRDSAADAPVPVPKPAGPPAPPPPTRRPQTPDFLSEADQRRPTPPPRPLPKLPASQTTPAISSIAAQSPQSGVQPVPRASLAGNPGAVTAAPAAAQPSNSDVRIAVGLIETVNARFEPSGSVRHVNLIAILTLSFPAIFVRATENVESLMPLSFKLANVDRAAMRHNQALLSETEPGVFAFNMAALLTYLRSCLSKNGPAATFCNVDCVTFERPLGADRAPLSLSAQWRCSPAETVLTLRYAFASSTTAGMGGEPSVCAFRTEVSGGVSFMESRPGGQFSNERQMATWRFDSAPPRDGSISARFTLQDGPSTPSCVAAAFTIENVSLSGAHFQLVSPGYVISLLKRRVQSSQYECEPTIEPY